MSAGILAVAIISLAFAAWFRLAGAALAKVPRADALRDASDDIGGAAKVARLLEEREDITPAVAMAGSAIDG